MRWSRVAGGWLLVLAGVVGFVLPIIPGVPLLIAGLVLLSSEYVWAKRALIKVKAWWARVRSKP